MRNTKIMCVIAVLIMVVVSGFAREFSNYTIETFVSQSQLETLSGVTGAIAMGIAVDTDGSIICFVDPSGTDGKLIDIAADGSSATEICPEVGTNSLDSGQATPTGDIDMNGMVVASDGTIYISEYDGDDDIIKVVPSPLAISNVAVVQGNAGIALDETNNRLFIPTEVAYGGNDDIKYFPLPSGPVQTAATTAQITAATGASGVAVAYPVLKSDGKLLVRDEAYYGGYDGILGLTNPGASPTISIEYATTFFPDGAPGISDMVIDSENNLYLWNEYSAGSSRITIIRASDNQVTEIAETDINTALGFSNLDPNSGCGLAVKLVDANTTILYFTNPFDPAGGGIYKITFTTTEVGSWHLY